MLQNDLRWTQHVSSLLKKIAASVTLCKTLAYRHRLQPTVIKRFYLSFIRPKLEYCSAVWCGASKACLKRLEQIQTQLACTFFRVYLPTAALTATDLPTLAWRRREHCLVMLWKLVHSQGPPQLKELLPLLLRLMYLVGWALPIL